MQENLSLEDVARDYGRMVSSICRRMIEDADTARDAAQQVWEEIAKSFPSFRGDSKISTWIYTITRRVAADYAVNEKTCSMQFVRAYLEMGDIDPPVQPELDKAIWVKQMCDRCLTAILHCVDNETRLAHIFRDVAQLEYDEIARILTRDQAAVRQMISRSRRRVNSFMRNNCTLYNPSGDCRCRIKRHVAKVNLAEEYRKVYDLADRANFFVKSEAVLPGKNYWENLL